MILVYAAQFDRKDIIDTDSLNDYGQGKTLTMPPPPVFECERCRWPEKFTRLRGAASLIKKET
jgi:hypothetical protein